MATTPAGEVIYEVEARLDPTVVAEFDAWLPGHVREVISCEGFTGAEMQVPVGEDAGGEVLRRTQYRVASLAALQRYFEQDAPRLRADGAARFGDQVRFSRRILGPTSVPLSVTEPPATCRNCGARVPGRFCAECGQSRDIHVLSMHEVLGDVTHSLLHLDSRVWRTLKALVLKPGLLTNEFIAGRHQLFLPPFRLYLVISVLFFTLSALLPGDDSAQQDATGEIVVAGGLPAEAGGGAAASRGQSAGACEVDLGGTWFEFLEARLEDACTRIKADRGKHLRELFLASVPKLMFLFLPLIAAVAKLFYWKPRRLYAEHLVVFLHTHALVFLWLAAYAVLAALATCVPRFGGWITTGGGLMLMYVPWYVFRAMRVVYGEGRTRTTLKFMAISTLYFVLLGVTLFAGLVYSVLSQ